MKRIIRLSLLVATPLLLTTLLPWFPRAGQAPPDTPVPVSRLGNVEYLQSSYDRWKAGQERTAGETLVLPLRWFKGLSSTYTEATGQATLDPAGGSVSVEIRNLYDTSLSEVWLVDNLPGEGSSVLPDSTDAMIRVGRLEHTGSTARLQAGVDPAVFAGFDVDLVVVTRADEGPEQGVLFGAPSLFQRLYRNERRQPASREVQGAANARSVLTLGPMPAHAAPPLRKAALLEDLIAQGEALFLNETFEGNGRTCGTCHPAENNFTIDPAYIATLPDDDPLFVAESVPSLNTATNGGMRFENPTLMRAFGLILLNIDGFDNLADKYVLRSVPHVFNLALSMTPATLDRSTVPPEKRLGWSGDGAPGQGTLRDLITAAIVQHFPKTLNRQPGTDFRLATDEELDAMEAFLLSLTSGAELNLSALSFKNSDVNTGKQVFISRCFRCHGNAGANMQQGADKDKNSNFDTSVELFPHPADALGQPRPRDAGFGLAVARSGGFGDGRFNTPRLVEAADTPPFFHNNVVNTIEAAVAFYNSDQFRNSPAARTRPGTPGVPLLTPLQIDQIAALLRTLNALENIRIATGCAVRAQEQGITDDGLALCTADIEDAVEVLQGGPLTLFPPAVDHLQAALALTRDAVLDQAVAEMEAARGEILTVTAQADVAVEAGESAALPPPETAAGTAAPAPTPGLTLFPNYPNPFNPSTEIRFELSQAGPVEVKVFNMLGREVRTLAAGRYEAGTYLVRWDGTDNTGAAVASGTYLYRLQAGPATRIRTMNLVK